MVFTLPFLFAEAAKSGIDQTPSDLVLFGYWLLMLFVAFVPAFVVGNMIAAAVRMKDYGWKIGLILCTLTCSAVVIAPKPSYLGVGWPPKLGIDLNGGAILVYKVNLEGEAATDTSAGKPQVQIGDVVEAVGRRINPDGLKEIVVRPFGGDHIEIIVPEVDTIEVDRIKRSIEAAGQLEFMISADRQPDHEPVVAKAKGQAESNDPKLSLHKKVFGTDGKAIGLWVGVGRDKEIDGGKFKVSLNNWTIRNPKTGEIIDETTLKQDGLSFEDQLKNRGIEAIEVLMMVNPPNQLVTGGDLAMINSSFDSNNLTPKVDFTLRGGDAARRMGVLTGENLSKKSGNGSREQDRHLGIVLDGSLLSAPSIQGTISDSGQITGRFTAEEVDSLVRILRSGKLPATLDKSPVRDDIIDPTLGKDTIVQGSNSIVIALVVVVLFMSIYYRFSGVVACIALTINVILVIAVMILIKAPFTLPGLAGLVLTVGMSVDANVLIYERMREELAKGAALRMTIRNGFDRAFVTILDSNLTTVLTAVILYAIGTDQVRGFAVTLILGIMISMFTAIFCSRVLFDISERNRWLTDLKMMRVVGVTNFDFMSHWKTFSMISVVLIAIGLVATGIRGKGMFDIDFLGGTSVQPVFKDVLSTDQVRKQVSETFDEKKIQFSLYGIHFSGQNELEGKVYKIDTTLPKVDQLREALKEAFIKNGESLLANYKLDFDAPKAVVIAAAAIKTPVQTETLSDTKLPVVEEKEEKPAATEKPSTDAKPGDTKQQSESKEAVPPNKPADAKQPEESPKAETKPEEKKPAAGETKTPTPDKGSRAFATQTSVLAFAEDADAAVKKLAEETAPKTTAPPAAKDANTSTATTPASPAESPTATAKPEVKTTPKVKTSEVKTPETKIADVEKPIGEKESTATVPAATTPTLPREVVVMESNLKFSHPITSTTLAERIEMVATELNIPQPTPQLFRDGAIDTSGKMHKGWTVRLSVSEADAMAILTQLQTTLGQTPVFLSSSEIGGAVAKTAQSSAIYAILASLVGIVLYIWVRFQSVIWGLGAVLALVHDVLMMLAAIACSLWLAPYLGFLQVEEFKINLVIVAAFLTLVGYSINDTIVLFDRLREVKGKSPKLTAEMINLSINQTLSRTILTAVTVFMVVVILYFLGGPSIHGFAFSLVVGVFVGTYSSVFIAAPVMLWMSDSKSNSTQPTAPSNPKKATVNER